MVLVLCILNPPPKKEKGSIIRSEKGQTLRKLEKALYRIALIKDNYSLSFFEMQVDCFVMETELAFLPIVICLGRNDKLCFVRIFSRIASANFP